MVKKKEGKLSKMPMVKIGLWVVGILVGMIVVIILGLKIWVSTWPEYKGEGFSIRYPKQYFYDGDQTDTAYDGQGVFFVTDIADSEENIEKESFRIFIHRYPKPTSQSYDTYANDFKTNFKKYGYSKKTDIYINDNRTIEFWRNAKPDYYGDYDYTIDTDKYIYEVSTGILINKPLWRAFIFDLIAKEIVWSFKTN